MWGGQISLVEPRISIAWGGFSQCVGQKVLLENCLNKKSYDRIFFLSGLDYVLVSDNEFKSFFDVNKNKEFVCGFNLTTSNIKSQQGRFKYYHYFRDIPLKHNSILRRIIIVGTRLFLKGLGLRKPLQVPISQNEKWDIYYGSSWMSMTNECAKYVLSQMKDNSVLNKYFSTSYTPDELYIPTIVMNSSFKNHAIEVKENNFNKLTPLHYLNYRGYIYSYDENDYDKIMSSGKIFVRKLVSGKSEKLIEMINQHSGIS